MEASLGVLKGGRGSFQAKIPEGRRAEVCNGRVQLGFPNEMGQSSNIDYDISNTDIEMP